GLARGHQPLDVVTERDGAASLQIEVAERASRTLGPGLEVIEEDARVVGHERGAEPTVGDLAGELEAARREGREVDRDVGARLGRGAERLALAARQRQLVDLPLERHALTVRGLAHYLHDLAHARERPIEAQSVPAFDHL